MRISEKKKVLKLQEAKNTRRAAKNARRAQRVEAKAKAVTLSMPELQEQGGDIARCVDQSGN
jgi:hypothetical protein